MQTPWNRGYVQLYTGDGKGKTTAALGLALRAAGHGLRSYIGQFVKGRPSGEHEAVRRLGGLITIELYGSGRFLSRAQPPDPAEAARAREGLARARAAMLSGDYRIVVLDEVCVAIRLGLLSVAEVLGVIREKPQAVELVLTGGDPPFELAEAADLVTDMLCGKHYFRKGVEAREGIEE
ncbi:MAG TPA: cob(I)yrinic acid a,c-diamide adenosyltransferase [Planctomycetota bacterium]|nr:cob(I)yrinic acid a,c-diamide adenosyltransferase [Planctomycetota bacterium]